MSEHKRTSTQKCIRCKEKNLYLKDIFNLESGSIICKDCLKIGLGLDKEEDEE